MRRANLESGKNRKNEYIAVSMPYRVSCIVPNVATSIEEYPGITEASILSFGAAAPDLKMGERPAMLLLFIK